MKSLLLMVSFIAGAVSMPAWPSEYPQEEPIQITGMLLPAVFPGPPNFESIGAGDRKEEVWLLRSATVPPGSHARTEDYQIVVLRDLDGTFARLRHLSGHRVAITGTLWCQISGHHHTPFLITPRAIDEAPSDSAAATPGRRPSAEAGPASGGPQR